MLLLVSSFAFAQNWSQVGNAQFTNFASDGAMSFHPTTGEPYVIFNNVIDGNKPYVMKFDGTNWVTIGSGAIISNEVRLANIAFNPSTNEPNVAFKNITTDRIDIYKFDGTNWVAIETSLTGSSAIREIAKLSLQYDTNDDLYVFGHINANATNHLLRRYHDFGGSLGWYYEEEYVIRDMPSIPVSYNEYVVNTSIAHPAVVQRSDVRKINFAAGNYDFQRYVQPARLVKMASVPGGDYWAGDNEALGSQTTQKIIFGYKDQAINQPLNTDDNTNGILALAKDEILNRIYLMYSDSNQELQFQKFSANLWSYLPALNISTSGSGFFSEIKFNPIDNNLYLLFLDGGKLSVKKYEPVAPLTKYYVNANVSGGNGSGDSWANAITDLNTAFATSGPNTTEIWVAAGTYKPSASARSASFNLLVDNLQVIGGFDGTETSISQRNIAANPTILSGDLNGNDAGHGSGTRGDNSYHVVQINANNVVLDGFNIEKGHANGSSTNAYGGGLLISDTAQNPVIKNCEFNSNYGFTGGAIRVYHNVNTSTVIENCTFNDNYSRYGSGLYVLVNNNRTATLDLINCLFINNRSFDINSSNKGYTGSSVWARANGSASNLTSTITNCTFANNTDIGTQSGSERGTLALSKRTDGNATHNATINNSIFYDNEGVGGATTASVNQGHATLPNLTFVNNSIGEDGFSNLTYLTNTSNASPMLNLDFTLQMGSPAIDSGDNSKIPAGVTTDLFGHDRIHNTTVDMGVYEYGSTLNVDSFEIENKFTIFPNPTSNVLNIKMQNGIKHAIIYNVQGQKVLDSTSKNINVSNLSSGMYLLQIEDTNGARHTKRFIKK